MTAFHWPDVRDRAITAFAGETPQGPLEDAIIVVFEQHPALVAKAVDQVAKQYANGEIRSGWAVLRHRVVELAEPRSTATASDTKDRDRKIRQAEQWMRTGGLHIPTEDELLDELFGSRGLLEPWHADATLRQRMLNLWREQRPTGEQLDLEQEERLDKWRQQQQPADREPDYDLA